ncbi:hypothetical protein EV363DRAFT_1344502 [Boletus edulis]|nr:hypothetical protein EV363DRAFT_1344502 [Boletus edulis]
MDAIKCFNQMKGELAGETTAHDERAKWAVDFTQRCAGKLEYMGDIAISAQQLDEAITQYSTALSLHPVTPQGVFMKRSKAYIAKGLWEDAIDDTNQVIMIDPSFPWGYERALVEWAKANLTDGAWRNALKTACSVCVFFH